MPPDTHMPPPDGEALLPGERAIRDAVERAKAMDPAGGEDDGAVEQAPAGRKGRRGGAAARDVLVELARQVELWHDEGLEGYATVPVAGHHEHWPIRSRGFRLWLRNLYVKAFRAAPGAQAEEDALRTLEALAVADGEMHQVFRRVGRRGQDVYVDLCDTAWRVIRISPTGWQVCDGADVKFLRTPAMRPLPAPEAGGMIEDLRGFLNVATEADFHLLVAWLVGAWRPDGPYPVLLINGEQGSAKSTATRLLRELVDPHLSPVRAAPKDEEDLQVAAANNHVIALDNLSTVPPWLSDSLCRLATGGGFSTRERYTDKSEAVFYATRPVILNGIPDLGSRPDLGDRALSVTLQAIPEEARRTERELWADFERSRPAILGALCDALAAGLRNLPHTRLERTPRLADFAVFVTAAEPGLGWEAGGFMRAYATNRREIAAAATEASPLAAALLRFGASLPIQGGRRWSGTASDLLEALRKLVSETTAQSPEWPRSPVALGTALTRLAPVLRGRGLEIERRKGGADSVRLVHVRYGTPAVGQADAGA